MATNVNMYAALATGGGLSDYASGRGAMALSGFKFLTQGNEVAQAVGDVGDMGFAAADTIGAFNQFRQLQLGAAGTEATLLSQAGNAVSGAAPAISTLAKVNAVTGVIGLGFSTVDFVKNVDTAINTSGSEKNGCGRRFGRKLRQYANEWRSDIDGSSWRSGIRFRFDG